MKIYGYTAFSTNATNTTLKSQYILLTAHLQQGISGYYWHYDWYEGVANALEELKKCNGYLIGERHVDLTKEKLISECTDEELENYIRMEKKL